MNKLDTKTRALIIRLLVEGNSIRATCRIADVSKNTVAKLLEDAGKACAAYHDEHVQGVQAKHVQADEIWAFCYAKERNVKAAKAAPADAGDIWTWTALDPASLDDRYAAAGVPAGLRLGLAALQPVLFNRYRRRYYASVDGRFRATIDDRMTFRQILAPDAALRGREADVPGGVLELKYRLADETRLPDLVGDLPYRVTRSSKYVNGIRATWR